MVLGSPNKGGMDAQYEEHRRPRPTGDIAMVACSGYYGRW